VVHAEQAAQFAGAFGGAGDAVLLGTASFWEGVDVAGPALSCVIIDKLPFASPGDPVMQARLDALRAAGGNPFAEYQLPQAVIALKQGAGRLIRGMDDRGVLVLCDPRLRSRGYGRVFLDSLPPMAWCATLRRRDPEIEVVAGRMVERSESGFVEGAWAGLLFKEDFDSAYAFCGSGAKVAKDRVIFCTSTDTLQPIYVYRTGDQLFASNSLPFILCRSKDILNPEYLSYDLDIMAIKHSLKQYINSIPTSRGKVEMHYFCNLSVG
jgi:hypothetical protein